MITSVRIYFQGDQLEPSTLTHLLNVEPSRSHKSNERRVVSPDRTIAAKTGLWMWESIDRPKKLTLNEHVQKLWFTFKGSAQLAASLPNVESAWIDILILESETTPRSSKAHFVLDSHAMLVLSWFGLPVEFTVGFVEP